MQRLRSLASGLTVASALVIAAGCHDAAAPSDTTTDPDGRLASLTMIPMPPVGASDIRGVVLHVDARGTELGTVAGARITVSRVDVDPGTDDTASARKTLTRVGVITTSADGRFQLLGVGRGYFALDVEPPAAATLAVGRAWSVSLLPSDPGFAKVYLYAAP